MEDEADIRAIAQVALKSVGGFATKICSSGNEAISTIAEFNPDLILLDVMMPEMDGPTTLKEIRKMPAFLVTPVIFLTAKVQPLEVQALRDLGATDVIAKPFDPMELAKQIKEIWDKL